MNIYNIVMKKNTFFKYSNNIVAKSVRIDDGQVYFKTDNITKKFLDDNKISYKLEDSLKSKASKKICTNLVLILGAVIFILVVYINTFRISRISFNGNYLINKEIEALISSKYKHFLFWDFISEDLEEMSKDLRMKYSEYEWISTYKDGTTIYVIINDNNEVSNSTNYGDIVATKDAIIRSYKVYNGKSMVKENQYVKKGDVLISGNTNDVLTEARGVVLGTTFIEKTITIDKEDIISKESGLSYKYTLFSLFKNNFSIGKKNKYESYTTSKRLIFNFFDIFKIYKIEEKEICDIIKSYSFEEALNLAKENIYFDFSLTKRLDEEEIQKVELLRHDETDTAYSFRFLIKQVESIGEFQKY